ncbi:MAG: acyl-CoA dehydrogenase family protein [Acidaminococcales bacterium]|jgi:alkylation response protein AidB-like acyl-CoA dehydrogenase|nr:acyl-CoA dehydrogenase family protein [Acidaminococcales bacterium]
MEFKLTDIQEMVQETAREVAQKVIWGQVAQIEKERHISDGIAKAVADAGILGIPFPEEYGGIDAGYIAQALAFEEIAKVSPSVSLSLLVSVTCLEAVRHYGSAEQKEKYLKAGIEGEFRASLAFTEAGTGSDPKQILTTYRKEGSGFVINGAKRFITNAAYKGPILLFAKNEQTLLVSAFMFEKFTEGYSLSTPWDTVGCRGSAIYDIFLDDVRIPASALLGKEADGHKILLSSVAHSKVALCATFVGIMAAGYEAAVKYAKEKTHRGAPIAKFQSIQLKIATIAAMVESARLMTYKLAEESENRSNIARMKAWVGLAKAYVSDIAVECNSMVMKVLGPYGVTEEFLVEKYMRDALIAPNIEGVSDMQRVIAAGYILNSDDLLI